MGVIHAHVRVCGGGGGGGGNLHNVPLCINLSYLLISKVTGDLHHVT